MNQVVTLDNTRKNIVEALAKGREGKHGEAMLLLNAACYWARTERPEWAYLAMRREAEIYRATHFPRKTPQTPL